MATFFDHFVKCHESGSSSCNLFTIRNCFVELSRFITRSLPQDCNSIFDILLEKSFFQQRLLWSIFVLSVIISPISDHFLSNFHRIFQFFPLFSCFFQFFQNSIPQFFPIFPTFSFFPNFFQIPISKYFQFFPNIFKYFQFFQVFPNFYILSQSNINLIFVQFLYNIFYLPYSIYFGSISVIATVFLTSCRGENFKLH